MGRVQRATEARHVCPHLLSLLHSPPDVMSNDPPSSPLRPTHHPPMGPPPSILQWFLLALPAAVLLAYFLTAFPLATTDPAVYPSLATLPPDSPSWQIYPETYYDGGAYVHFPQGTVRRERSWLGDRCLSFRAGPILAHWPGEGRAGE